MWLMARQSAADLIVALDDEKAQRSVLRRGRVINALGRTGDSRAVAPLVRLFETEQSGALRTLIVLALGQIGDPSAAPALREALGNPREARQAEVISSLAALRDRESVPRLIDQLLEAPDPVIQHAAAIALGEIGDHDATLPLTAALHNGDLYVRLSAARGLTQLGGLQALSSVREAHESAKGLWRLYLGRSLKKLEARTSLSWQEQTGHGLRATKNRITTERLLTAPELIAEAVWRRIETRLSRRKQRAVAVHHGWRLIGKGHDQEALEHFESAIQKFPEDASIQLSYATILLVFRPEDVVTEITKAVELAPDDPVILVRAAHLVFDRGKRDVARTWTCRANELAQPDFVLMSGLEHLNALFAGIDGEYDVAEEKLRSIVKIDPTFSSYAMDLARLLAFRGRQREAIAVIDESLKHVKDKDGLERVRARVEKEICSQ
jgi:HEAT repeat protein